jgi:hypothetical protein
VKGYPAIKDPGSIEKLLERSVRTSPPVTADRDYLAGLGFRREVDTSLLELLVFLGFTDAGGVPTRLWSDSIGPGAAGVLGRTIRKSYRQLFSEVPEAHATDGTMLMDFFRRSTGVSDPDAAYMVLTFKVLCDLAEIPPAGRGSELEPPVPPEPPVAEPEPAEPPAAPFSPAASQMPEKSAADCPEITPMVRGRCEAPVIRLSIHIDISGDSDPQMRELANRLLRKQLETGGN